MMQGNKGWIDISLVVLTFDRPHDLSECLESMRAMDRSDIACEIVVIDDGSTVDNRRVLERFEEQLPLRYHRQLNGGVASARNTGIEVSRGRCIGFIADDYRLPKTYLKDVSGFFRENPDAFVITHNIQPTGPSVFRCVQRFYFQMALLQRFESEALAGDVVTSYSLPPSRAAVFRRELFDRVGPFNEAFRVGEDGELGMRMTAEGIPVHFFTNKYILHWEHKSLWGYLQQRLSYGRSFFRALQERNPDAVKDVSVSGTVRSIRHRYGVWKRLSRELGRRAEFVRLAPCIGVFLAFFYAGYYLESRKGNKAA